MDKDEEVDARLVILEKSLVQLMQEVAKIAQSVNAMQLAISGAMITMEGPEHTGVDSYEMK